MSAVEATAADEPHDPLAETVRRLSEQVMRADEAGVDLAVTHELPYRVDDLAFALRRNRRQSGRSIPVRCVDDYPIERCVLLAAQCAEVASIAATEEHRELFEAEEGGLLASRSTESLFALFWDDVTPYALLQQVEAHLDDYFTGLCRRRVALLESAGIEPVTVAPIDDPEHEINRGGEPATDLDGERQTWDGGQ